MKKILIYILLFIIICFILPAIFTNNAINAKETISNVDNQQENNNENQEKNSENTEQNSNYEYKKYGTIKLLHQKTGQVEEVELDNYLLNVVSAEMPATFEIEALKAQAIVARTYTVYKIKNKKHENADICDDSSCCQAWISKEDRLAKWEESKREENWKKIEECIHIFK